MAFNQGGSVEAATGDARPFTMSPDYAFPPNRSLPGSSTTNSPRTPPSLNPTPSDAIERHRSCRAYSIDFYFPPADSEASSDSVVLSDSASSSPAAWKETLQLDRIHEVLPVVGKHNHLPLRRFQGMSTIFKQGVQSTRMSSLVGTGLQTAFEILDAVGSNLPNLYRGSGFFSNISLKGNKVSILAFEIASTVIRGATLLKSLSEENLDFFEKETLFSTGVRTLVSNDAEELLRVYASEKREELDRLSRKLIMLGNICKAPQWHHLDIYFSCLDSSDSHCKMPKDEAELNVNQLVILAQYTLELYYSLQDLEKLEKEYMQKFHEPEAINPSQRGELKFLQSELKAQRKHVRSLKKKSFWSRSLEELMESLVDAFTYIHQSFMEVFGKNASGASCENLNGGPESLGKDGLALRYANIIKLIDKIASDPSAVSPDARDSLYDALPASVKMALRFRLSSRGAEEEHLSASEIKAEMNKTLEWLVPLATNTFIALLAFGWVREWTNTRIEFDNGKTANYNNLSWFQTIYHAKKHKTDDCVLELVVWLHRLIRSSRKEDNTKRTLPWESEAGTSLDNQPIFKTKTQVSPSPDDDANDPKPGKAEFLLSAQNRLLSEEQIVVRSKSSPVASETGGSISFDKKKGKSFWGLSRSMGSPAGHFFGDRAATEHQSASILDVMDGLDLA